MRANQIPADRPEPRVEERRIVTAAPSPHQPRGLWRRRGGQLEFCTQDGWVPVRDPVPVILPEGYD